MPISAKDFNTLVKNIQSQGAQLVAVSKTKSIAEIQQVYDLGQRIFGENRAQELRTKQAELPQDIAWHMIGTLQTNKVKYIAPFVDLIHSVDSWKLLKEINKQGERNERVISVLLQMHIAEEDTKSGFNSAEIDACLLELGASPLPFVKVCGVMGMATFTSNQNQIRKEFKQLKSIFDRLKKDHFPSSNFKEISMGMSGDYEIALEEGATLVRIGSKIFGSRNY